MASIDRFTLILPAAMPRLRAVREQDPALERSPALNTLLRSGHLRQQWSAEDCGFARLDGWQTALLHVLGAEAYKQGLAGAELSWRGAGGDVRDGTYLHLEPVYLAAGLDRLQLSSLEPLNAAESSELLATVQPLLALDGFELQLSAGGDWYAWCGRRLDLTTYSPRSPFVGQVDAIMPGGADGPRLRRLMTEVQMSLHQLPLNTRRERQGLPSANALWPWGAGHLSLVTVKYAQRVFGAGSYLAGLCEHLRIERQSLPADAKALLDASKPQTIAVISPPADDASLECFDSTWLRPLERAALRGRIKKLELCMDRWSLSVDGGRWSRLRRSLRSTRNIAELFN